MKAFGSSVSESGTKIKVILLRAVCLFDLCFHTSSYGSLDYTWLVFVRNMLLSLSLGKRPGDNGSLPPESTGAA